MIAFTHDNSNGKGHDSMDMSNLAGVILTWDVPGGREVTASDVRNALIAADLDPSTDKERRPDAALRRAFSRLDGDRVVRKAPKDASTADRLAFQLNRIDAVAGQYEYPLETVIAMDRETGKIEAGDATLQAEVERLFPWGAEVRTSGDITRLVQKLFAGRADLYAINPRKGGAYFVPAACMDFIAKVERFAEALGVQLWRFPVPRDGGKGDESIRDAMEAGIMAQIHELEAAVAGFGDKTRETTMERAVERFQAVRFKVESYADLLEDRKAKLVAAAEAARVKAQEAVIKLMEQQAAADEAAA